MDHSVLFYFFLPLLLLSDAEAASFRFVNRCRHTVWPGLLSGANSAQLPTTGFSLPPSKSRTVHFPRNWSGRVWARTLCSTDSSGKFSCLTGDCGSGSVQCNGAGAIPPATLAEFTLNGAGGLDFYDVSLVDGYNLPLLVVARDGSGGGDCSPTGCLVDLNRACPAGLRVAAAGGRNVSGRVGAVACKSACEAFGDPQYCCSESYSTPDTCRPSVYSQLFKHACPRAYSYAYDDKTSTFTCASADYTIIFCPPPYTSEKLLGARRMAGELPLVNKSMMYLHSNGRSSRSSFAFITQLQNSVTISVTSMITNNLTPLPGAFTESGSGLAGEQSGSLGLGSEDSGSGSESTTMVADESWLAGLAMGASQREVIQPVGSLPGYLSFPTKGASWHFVKQLEGK